MNRFSFLTLARVTRVKILAKMGSRFWHTPQKLLRGDLPPKTFVFRFECFEIGPVLWGRDFGDPTELHFPKNCSAEHLE